MICDISCSVSEFIEGFFCLINQHVCVGKHEFCCDVYEAGNMLKVYFEICSTIEWMPSCQSS
jgi:hypothetical protein